MTKKKTTKKSVLDQVKGFKIHAVKAGLKASGNFDLGVIVADAPASAAGVFTQSNVCAAPVTISRKNLQATSGHARAILVNAGNANACTGKTGMANARETAKRVAFHTGCKMNEVLLCSTGIIGEQLNMDKYFSGIDKLFAEKAGTGNEFTRAILTTDLVEKAASKVLRGEVSGRIAGVCKGSGMIAPKMATMLGFIITDIPVTPAVLQTALKDVVTGTFNSVTVDGDTSTNDTVLVLSSGAAGGKTINRASGKAYNAFREGLFVVCYSLAEKIARDGEGATKLVRVSVSGARTPASAAMAARTIAESPLVKTAMFGCDPNWGRIIMALGRSGCPMKEDKTVISLCGKKIFINGTPQKFDAAALSKKMKAKEVDIKVELGIGKAEARFLTCDYSYDYIKINAEYHT